MPPKRRLTGTVGVVGMDTGRFSEFTMSMARLDLPKGWEHMGAFNYDCAHACNFLADNFEGDALMLMGDDHSFAPDMLKRVLEHDLPIVAPLCLSRRSPFHAVARKDGKPLEPGALGLVEVDVTGSAGMVIRREVFESMEAPYFQTSYQPDGTLLTDDIFFCRKAKEAGYSIYVDTSIPLGHLALVEIAPEYEDGTWSGSLDIAGLQLHIS